MLYQGRKAIRRIPGKVIKAIPLPTPVVTQGFGTREQIGQICTDASFKRVLVVTDKTLSSLGLHNKVLASLSEHSIPYAVFNSIDSEPTIEVIEAGRRAAVDFDADSIVAIGGGSVLDTSKIIASSARHPKRPLGYYLQKFAIVEDGSLPMVNVPSTAGTGAEWTVGAVIGNKRGTKSSTVVAGLRVPHVVLDSELIANVPRELTAWSAIDALSHGLEGLMADVDSSGQDMLMSQECVRLVLENLPVLLKHPHDTEARQATLLAAHYGGNAINTQLAGYVHAFAHSIGALYHIPHGKAIAWCLVPLLLAQEHLCCDQLSQLAIHCRLASKQDSKEMASDKLILAIRELLDACDLEGGCSLICKDDYPRLIRMIDFDSINYSPPRILMDTEIAYLLDLVRKGC